MASYTLSNAVSAVQTSLPAATAISPAADEQIFTFSISGTGGWGQVDVVGSNDNTNFYPYCSFKVEPGSLVQTLTDRRRTQWGYLAATVSQLSSGATATLTCVA